MSPHPKLVVDSNDDEDYPSVQAIPGQIPSFTASSDIPSFMRDTKRSILKSSLRTYEDEPVRLTPGLDPSNLSTSPIAEPVIDQPRVRFASTDQIFQVNLEILCFQCINPLVLVFRLQKMIKLSDEESTNFISPSL